MNPTFELLQQHQNKTVNKASDPICAKGTQIQNPIRKFLFKRFRASKFRKNFTKKLTLRVHRKL